MADVVTIDFAYFRGDSHTEQKTKDDSFSSVQISHTQPSIRIGFAFIEIFGPASGFGTTDNRGVSSESSLPLSSSLSDDDVDEDTDTSIGAVGASVDFEPYFIFSAGGRARHKAPIGELLVFNNSSKTKADLTTKQFHKSR